MTEEWSMDRDPNDWLSQDLSSYFEYEAQREVNLSAVRARAGAHLVNRRRRRSRALTGGALMMLTGLLLTSDISYVRQFDAVFSTADAASRPISKPAIVTETFAGNDPDGWPYPWRLGHDPLVNRSARVVDGFGQLSTSGAPAGGNGWMSRRLTTMSGSADVDITVTFKFDSSRPAPSIVIRDSGYYLGMEDGYSLSLDPISGYRLIRHSSSDINGRHVLGRVLDPAYEPQILYSARIVARGSRLRAKVWESSDGEPNKWGIDVRDTHTSEAGMMGLRLDQNDVGGAPSRWYVKQVVVRS